MAKDETAPRRLDPGDAGPRRNTSILGRSRIFVREVIDDIHVKAQMGRYRMRGMAIFKADSLLGTI